MLTPEAALILPIVSPNTSYRPAHDLTALDETRRRQVELAEKLQAREPASVDRQRGLALAYKYQGRALVDLAFSQASIGSLRRDEGDLESALDSYRREVKLGQRVYARRRRQRVRLGTPRVVSLDSRRGAQQSMRRGIGQAWRRSERLASLGSRMGRPAGILGAGALAAELRAHSWW